MGRVLSSGLLALVAGCGSSDSANGYFPPEDQARRALDTALSAWQQGAIPGQVPGTANPVIQLVDSHIGPGRRLKSYQVLGLAPGDGPRVFTVQLNLEGPTAEVRTR